jgi:hypothetical protein
VNVRPPLRRAGIVVTGFVVGLTCGAAGAGLLVSLLTLTLTITCVEIVTRLTEEP